jgi:hypothetical protein
MVFQEKTVVKAVEECSLTAAAVELGLYFHVEAMVSVEWVLEEALHFD